MKNKIIAPPTIFNKNDAPVTNIKRFRQYAEKAEWTTEQINEVVYAALEHGFDNEKIFLSLSRYMVY